MIPGKSVNIRLMEKDEIPIVKKLLDLYDEIGIMREELLPPPEEIDEWWEDYRKRIPSVMVWVVTLKTGKIIGSFTLQLFRGPIVIMDIVNVIIDKEYLGQKYMADVVPLVKMLCFDIFNVDRMSGFVEQGNLLAERFDAAAGGYPVTPYGRLWVICKEDYRGE